MQCRGDMCLSRRARLGGAEHTQRRAAVTAPPPAPELSHRPKLKLCPREAPASAPPGPAPHCLRPFTWGLTQHSACVRLLSRSLTPRGLSVLCRGPLLSEAEPRSTAWVDPGVGPTTGCRAPGNAHLGSRGLSSQVALLSSAFGGAHVSSPRVTPASASVALPHRGLHRTLGISAPGGPDLAHSCGKTAGRPVSAARPREPGWPQTSAGRHRA